eukprot:1064575-Alexandrium_andersonii.AAC.1
MQGSGLQIEGLVGASHEHRSLCEPEPHRPHWEFLPRGPYPTDPPPSANNGASWGTLSRRWISREEREDIYAAVSTLP